MQYGWCLVCHTLEDGRKFEDYELQVGSDNRWGLRNQSLLCIKCCCQAVKEARIHKIRQVQTVLNIICMFTCIFQDPVKTKRGHWNRRKHSYVIDNIFGYVFASVWVMPFAIPKYMDKTYIYPCLRKFPVLRYTSVKTFTCGSSFDKPQSNVFFCVRYVQMILNGAVVLCFFKYESTVEY